VTEAGAVSVLYGSATGLSRTGGQLFSQVGGTPEDTDQFGSALAAGDFNHDGAADLAASAPLEDVGSVADAGAVSVLYGSAAGLSRTGGQLFSQVGGIAEDFDRFGQALAAGDFNHDGAADLAAGAPEEDVGSVADAGAVSVLYGSVAGLSRTGGQLFTQNSAGVPDYAEARAPAFSRYETYVRIAVDVPTGSWPAQKQCLPLRRRVDRMGRIVTNRENAGALTPRQRIASVVRSPPVAPPQRRPPHEDLAPQHVEGLQSLTYYRNKKQAIVAGRISDESAMGDSGRHIAGSLC